MAKGAIIYSRVSTAAQSDDGSSLDTQTAASIKLAQSFNVPVLKVYAGSSCRWCGRSGCLYPCWGAFEFGDTVKGERMELQLNISPEQINEMVSQAILDSAIGEQVRKAVEDKVKDLSRAYDNPIHKIVEKEIGREVERLVREEFGAQVKAAVKEKVTEQFTSDLMTKMWDQFVAKHY